MITSREETYHHVDQDQHPPALLAQGSSTQGALRAFVTHVSERGSLCTLWIAYVCAESFQSYPLLQFAAKCGRMRRRRE